MTHTGGQWHVGGTLSLGRYGSGEGTYVLDGTASTGGALPTTFQRVGAVTIEGVEYNVFDVMVTCPTDWTNSRLDIDLLEGSMYHHPLGGDTEPNPALVAAFPEMAWDTYVTVPGGYPAVASFAGPSEFAPAALHASWFDTRSTGAGTFRVARVTFSSDATGTLTGRNYDLATQGVGEAFGAMVVHGMVTSTSLEATDEYIGQAGTGLFTHRGGANLVAGNLVLGEAAGGQGTYELEGGSLVVSGETTIGAAGDGLFRQTGGFANGGARMTLGLAADGHGTYELDGGTLHNTETIVGAAGDGLFRHGDGEHRTGRLRVGRGTYQLRAGMLDSDESAIGATGAGTMLQTGGRHATGTLVVGAVGGQAVYSLGSPGAQSLQTQFVRVGTRSLDGTVYHIYDVVVTTDSDWTNSRLETDLTAGSLFQHALGADTEPNPALFESLPDLQWDTYAAVPGGFPAVASFAGACVIDESGFNASWFDSRDTGAGVFTIARLALSADAAGRISGRSYNVATAGEGVGFSWRIGEAPSTGGVLTATDQYIGSGGAGRFAHYRGTNLVEHLHIGCDAASAGLYEIAGGTLAATRIDVGADGPGELRIAGPDADVTVSGRLRFGAQGVLTAGLGATVRLVGGDLEITGTDPTALAALAALAVLIDGEQGASLLEVAGADLGATPAGWADNFAVGALHIGADTPGQAVLVDRVDNQGDGERAEALYVTELSLSAGSTLQTGGLRLYFLNGGPPKRLMDGDCNLDGEVQEDDLSRLLTNWKTDAGWIHGDFNGDRFVDDDDLNLMLSHWTGGIYQDGLTAVPEPTGLVLLTLGAAVLLRRRYGGSAG